MLFLSSVSAHTELFSFSARYWTLQDCANKNNVLYLYMYYKVDENLISINNKTLLSLNLICRYKSVLIHTSRVTGGLSVDARI